MLRSLNEDRGKVWGLLNPPLTEGFVHAQMIKGFMYIEHIDEDHCWFHGMMNVDPKFAMLPDWLLNFTIKRVIFIIIGRI